MYVYFLHKSERGYQIPDPDPDAFWSEIDFRSKRLKVKQWLK